MAALGSLEKTLDELLVKKAPFQLPANAKEWIVQFSPWITLILLILLLPAVLVVLGLGVALGGLASAHGLPVGPLYWVAMLVLLAQIVVMAISIPALMKRKRSGWELVFYSELASAVYAVVNWLSHPFDIVGLIGALIGVLIGLYVLFQIRPLYR